MTSIKVKPKIFNLKVIKIKEGCNFELSWGEGMTISAQLDYPQSLDNSYTQWRQAYLNCYKNLRGKVVKKGGAKKLPEDPQGMLREAEAHLLSEFHRWLRSKELYEIRETIIRETIADAARDIQNSGSHWVDVLLTCKTPELTRLPWEAWEINTKLSTPGSRTIRFSRVPQTIRDSTISPVRRKARVLAILGDDKGLNFKEEKQALRNLSNVAEVKFIGWQLGKYKDEDISQLKEDIVEAISDPKGWDILFFAGHSNETPITGGELSIAPNTAFATRGTIAIQDIAKPLQKARDRGLQFAIFNSCSGISIAESLIDLGLPQVAVMREPIHNNVAQEFLVQFLNSLAEYKDVHEALLDACAFLKENKNLTYPSTYLIPSLFRHPRSQLFRLEPFGVWNSVKSWLPTKKEAVYLAAFLTLSLIPPIQDLLVESRLLMQAAFYQFTQSSQNYVPNPNQRSPVLLVQIDRKSLKKDKVELINNRYMDYSYLARVLDKLIQSNARLIGVDYILDRDKQQPENTRKLQQAVNKAIAKGSWLVWGAYEADNEGVSPQIANLNQSMSGDISLYDWYVELPQMDCSDSCPFAYLLALSHCLLKKNLIQDLRTDNVNTVIATTGSNPKPLEIGSECVSPIINEDTNTVNLPQPQKSKTDFRESVISSINTQEQKTDFLQRLESPAINNFFQWFQPVIDYSIPPKQAYETISACELLGTCTPTPAIANANLQSKIIIVAPGGYEQAGVDEAGEDNSSLPLPIAFWRGRKGWNDFFEGEATFTGGEAHAYTVHHFLNQRLLVPIPNFLMVLLAAVVGKFIIKVLQNHPGRVKLGWVVLGTTAIVYVFVSLQVYISEAVLIPIFFPFLVLGNYTRLALKAV